MTFIGVPHTIAKETKPVDLEGLIAGVPVTRVQGIQKFSKSTIIVIATLSALLTPSRMLLGSGAPDDSAVFAYIGRAMTHGLMVYKDVWDHKGPLLYYFEYLGACLDPASTFGIGLLELVAWGFAFFLLYSIISSFASYRVMIVIAILSLAFTAHFSEGGNLCETWALLPLAIAHYCVWQNSEGGFGRQSELLLGICFAAIFWLRPNMAVFPAVAVFSLLYESARRESLRTATRRLAIVTLAAGGLTAIVLAPIAYTHSLEEMIKAYFGYNAAYSGSLTLPVRLNDTGHLLRLLLSSGLAILGCAGWGFSIERSQSGAEFPAAFSKIYLKILLFSFPIELAAACLSGRSYSHYLLPLFPALAVLGAWLLSEMEGKAHNAAIGRALVIGIMVGLAPVSLITYAEDFWATLQKPVLYLHLAEFVRHATNANDKIIVVGGAEAAYVTYYSQRMAASRFVYQYGLAHNANPDAAVQRQEFLHDLALNRPPVIISVNPVVGLLCSSELECRILNEGKPGLNYGYDSELVPELLRPLIASEYRLIADPRFEGNRVYLRRDVAVPLAW